MVPFACLFVFFFCFITGNILWFVLTITVSMYSNMEFGVKYTQFKSQSCEDLDK